MRDRKDVVLANLNSAAGLVSAINAGLSENRQVAAFVDGIGEVGGLNSAELAGAVITLTFDDGSKIYLIPSALTAVKSGAKAD